jgi:DNA-binding response OmpR family regulator
MAGKRVLIVDDALELGRMLRFALDSLEAGLDVRVVPSAEEAMLEASRQPVSLIVVDFRLPGMTGLELIDKIRARDKETRFILISGMSDDRFLEKARELKADRFMPKPLQISEFLEVASQMLGIRVRSDGPLPVAVQGEAEKDQDSGLADLAGVLTRLRQALGAQVALLANDLGKIVAQAGDLGGIDFEGNWGPALAALLTATARLGRLLQAEPPASAQVIRGDTASLIFAPVGVFALVVLIKADQSGLRSALAVEETLNAQKELIAILDRSGASHRLIGEPVVENGPAAPAKAEPVEVIPPVEEPSLGDLEKILKGKARSLDRTQAEQFWDQASDSEPFQSDNPDVITYDQAKKLGLTPEEDEHP